MDSPSFFSGSRRFFLLGVVLCLSIIPLVGCGNKVVPETPAAVVEKPKPPTAVPMWLGNGERNFYGSGPWKDGGLKVVWRTPVKAGYSGPAVADGRVFLTDFIRTTGPRCIAAPPVAS